VILRAIITVLLSVLAAANAQAQIGSANSPAVPRGIADITTLLQQYKPDAASVTEARAMLALVPPADASQRELLAYHERSADFADLLGQPGRMLGHRRQAAELARGLPDESEYLRKLSWAELMAGNYLNAVRVGESVLNNRHAHGGTDSMQRFNLGKIKAHIGEVAAAKQLVNEADTVLNRIRSIPAAARIMANFEALRFSAYADIAMAEGRWGEAESALRQSLGRWDSAIARAASARETAMEQRIRSSRDLVGGQLVQALLAQGKLPEAELMARDLIRLTLTRLGKDAPQAGVAIVRMAQVLLEQGRFKDAETLARRALQTYSSIGLESGSALRLAPHAVLVQSALGRQDWRAAARAVDQLGLVVSSADEVAKRIYRGSADTVIVLVRSGRAQEALPIADALLIEMSRDFGADHPRTAEVRGAFAMALAASGRDQEAVAEFTQASHGLLANLALGTTMLQTLKRRIIVESHIALLARLHGTALADRLAIAPALEAFRLADALRAGSVQKAVAASAARALANEPGLGELIRKNQDFGRETQALYDHILRLVSQPAEQQLPKVIADMRSRLLQIEREQKQTFAAIEKRFPEYANLVNPKPATLEEARKALRPGEALVSVFSTREKSYVWSVNPAGKLSFHISDLDELQIAAVVSRLRATLDPGDATLDALPAFDYAGAHKLYASLIAPAEAVWGGANALVFAASGALSQIPVAILPTAPVQVAKDTKLLFGEMRQVPWLARKIAVVDVPSVTALSRLRALPPGNPQRQAFAGFGDPVFSASSPAESQTLNVASSMRQASTSQPDKSIRRNLQVVRVSTDTDTSESEVDFVKYAQLSALPDTREEILSIAKALGADPDKDVFLGLQASRPQVQKTDLSKRRIVAFATHGLIPGDLPDLEQPALALSVLDDSKASPLLTLDDVLGLKLDADWVVLSACNTAAADGQGAEAVSGLGRGFFYAGSRALLVTHWPVETVSARLLTTGIFERYAKSGNVTRAEALNASMRALMEGTANGQYSYAHPLFWAPYALIGDGGR
jgi:CHAT domain-containing protein